MITDEMLFYFLFMTLLFIISIFGSVKSNILLILSLLASITLAVPIIIAFNSYYYVAFFLILINVVFTSTELIKMNKSD
jgi:hypothetical protein